MCESIQYVMHVFIIDKMFYSSLSIFHFIIIVAFPETEIRPSSGLKWFLYEDVEVNPGLFLGNQPSKSLFYLFFSTA